MDISVEAYLERIGITGRLAPTAENLGRLQKAHFMHVPYENLEIVDGVCGGLSLDELYDKIVVRRRGGYCFELNGLFGWLLRQLGYQVKEYFGRWLAGEVLEVPLRRHRVLDVTCEDGSRYIADVGVGRRSPLVPLHFKLDVVQPREGLDYRIVEDSVLGYIVQVKDGESFQGIFSFDGAPQASVDFTYVHYYLLHHPDSVFRRQRMMYISTEWGRNSLVDAPDPQTGENVLKLTRHTPEGAVVSYLRTPAQQESALRQYFGVERG